MAEAGDAAVNGTDVTMTLHSKLQNYLLTSSVMLSFLLLTGHFLRRQIRWLRALHLPASLVGGLVGWLLFALIELCGANDISDEWFSVGWHALPGFCTNVIFCCLFLGTPVPQPQEVLKSPRREHLIYGLVVVFGQYVVSAATTMVCQWADPELSPVFATVMPYGYAGGPVVAEAMRPEYSPASFNYPDGYPLALLAAAIGMFVGVIAGAILVNLAPLASRSRGAPLALGDAPAATSGEEATIGRSSSRRFSADLIIGSPVVRAHRRAVCCQLSRVGVGVRVRVRVRVRARIRLRVRVRWCGPKGARCAASSRPLLLLPLLSCLSCACAHTQGSWGRDPPPQAVRSRLGRIRAAMLELKQTASESDHYALDRRPSAGEQTVSSESLDSLMFHVCLVSLVMMAGACRRTPCVCHASMHASTHAHMKAGRQACMGSRAHSCHSCPTTHPGLLPWSTGYTLRLPFVLIEEVFPAGSFVEKSHLLSVLPLFLFCLIAGLLIQKTIDLVATDSDTGKSSVDICPTPILQPNPSPQPQPQYPLSLSTHPQPSASASASLPGTGKSCVDRTTILALSNTAQVRS